MDNLWSNVLSTNLSSRLCMGAGIMVFYITVGAVIYSIIEFPNEAHELQYIRDLKALTLQQKPCIENMIMALAIILQQTITSVFYRLSSFYHYYTGYKLIPLSGKFGHLIPYNMGKSCICCFPILNEASTHTRDEDELQEFQDNCWNMFLSRNGNLNLFLFTVTIFIYLVLGALLFHILENKNESETRDRLRHYMTEFIDNHKCLTGDDLEGLLKMVADVTSKGISPLRNASADPNWSFGQAFFFCGTLITTVGYGHVSPVTPTGKAFTILYCIIGIPLTLALLTAFVERLKIPSTWLLALMHNKWGSHVSLSTVRLVHLATLLMLFGSVLFIVPALIFMKVEPDWSFLDAFYYCFISLTTIGLGDYIPGDNPDQTNRALYKVFATGYLLIGLCFMMLFLSVLYEVPQFNCSKFFLLDNHNQPSKYDQPPNESKTVAPKYERQVDEGSPSNESHNKNEYNEIK